MKQAKIKNLGIEISSTSYKVTVRFKPRPGNRPEDREEAHKAAVIVLKEIQKMIDDARVSGGYLTEK